jgi:hypothetical protein
MASGPEPDIAECPLLAQSGHQLSEFGCLLCAISGLMHCSKKSYSIISSATESNVGGIDRPSALAAFRLMTSSNLVDCMTGRSIAQLNLHDVRFTPGSGHQLSAL